MNSHGQTSLDVSFKLSAARVDTVAARNFFPRRVSYTLLWSMPLAVSTVNKCHVQSSFYSVLVRSCSKFINSQLNKFSDIQSLCPSVHSGTDSEDRGLPLI